MTGWRSRRPCWTHLKYKIDNSENETMVETDVIDSRKRVRLFGVDIDVITMEETVDRIYGWLDQDEYDCHYVVTPNVHHAVTVNENPEFRAAYDRASLVVADGLPVILASRLVGKPLPERVAGSELVPAIFDRAKPDRELRCLLFGAMPGVADRAAEQIHRKWPGVKVVQTYCPPFGFEKDTDETERILKLFEEVSPELLIVGLSAPKQEVWVRKHYERFHSKAILCVGATIDFLAGEKQQAPVWMRRCGLEWCFRMFSEPKRLVGRYARDARIFPTLVWRELRGKTEHNGAHDKTSKPS